MLTFFVLDEIRTVLPHGAAGAGDGALNFFSFFFLLQPPTTSTSRFQP